MSFGHSKEMSHPDGSFEHPQHMFWLRNKKNNFKLRTLIWGPDYNLHVTDTNVSSYLAFSNIKFHKLTLLTCQ